MLVILPSPYPEAPACPSTFEVLRVRDCAPTLYPFVVFTFRLAIESTKEFGGVSFLKIGENFQFFVNFFKFVV